MHMYVELWTPKPTWHAMPKDERKAYVKRLGKVKDALLTTKSTLYITINKPDIPRRAPYQYITVWMLESEEGMNQIEAWADETKWHDYFQQVTSGGEIRPLDEVLGVLINE